MSGYYPHATGVLGYKSPRPKIGDRATWSQHFKNNGYYAARVSKIFHMGVPIGIEQGSNGADDEASWTERFNSKGLNGKRQVKVRLFRIILTARSLQWGVILLWSLKQMEMTLCTQMVRLPKGR